MHSGRDFDPDLPLPKRVALPLAPRTDRPDDRASPLTPGANPRDPVRPLPDRDLPASLAGATETNGGALSGPRAAAVGAERILLNPDLRRPAPNGQFERQTDSMGHIFARRGYAPHARSRPPGRRAGAGSLVRGGTTDGPPLTALRRP